ncbi:hypothetical protein NMG60_11031646 [Bertholletia excelsa]
MSAKAPYNREVESILANRIAQKRWGKPQTEYLVKWKGLPESEANWEDAKDLWQFQAELDAYHGNKVVAKLRNPTSRLGPISTSTRSWFTKGWKFCNPIHARMMGD